MNTTDHGPIQLDDARDRPHVERLSTAPLDAATSGQLVFPLGAVRVTLQGDPALVELYRARFVQHVPGVHLERKPAGRHPFAGPGPCKVTILYRARSSPGWAGSRHEPLAAIALNGSIPWEIEFHGGVANLEADLRQLRLRSLDLCDSSGVKLLLPRPAGTVYLYASGSASDVVIQRPAGVALRVQIAGRASQVRIDQQPFSAAATGIAWQTHEYHVAADRYDIRFAGSVTGMTMSRA